MITVKVYSRDNFIKNTFFNDINVESFQNNFFICLNSSDTTHEYGKTYFRNDHFNVINLFFDDTDEDKLKVANGIIYFARACTIEQAKSLKNFIENIPDDTFVHIYCAKGLSRSPAVAKFIEEYKNFNSKYEIIGYNQYVYNLLRGLC